MLYYTDKNRYYRFPGHESVLNYEKDHYIYCPPADSSPSINGGLYDTYGSFSMPISTTYGEYESYTPPTS